VAGELERARELGAPSRRSTQPRRGPSQAVVRHPGGLLGLETMSFIPGDATTKVAADDIFIDHAEDHVVRDSPRRCVTEPHPAMRLMAWRPAGSKANGSLAGREGFVRQPRAPSTASPHESKRGG